MKEVGILNEAMRNHWRQRLEDQISLFKSKAYLAPPPPRGGGEGEGRRRKRICEEESVSKIVKVGFDYNPNPNKKFQSQLESKLN